MRTHVGKAFRDRRGRLGARMTVDLTAHRVSAVYHIPTHGLTPEQIVAERTRIAAEHEKRAARYVGFASLRGQKIRHGSTQGEIEHCTIRRRGTDVELHVILRVDGARMRVTRAYPSTDAVPSNQEIVAIVRDDVVQRSVRDVVEKAHRRALVDLLGAEEERS